MTKTQKLATAALTGLFTVGLMAATPAFAGDDSKSGCNNKTGSKTEKANCKTADGKDKHACKGHNACKGMGADGKNACKGKGSCATDGSKAK
jgi:hypothetical protein